MKSNNGSRQYVPLYLVPFIILILAVLIASIDYFWHVKKNLTDDVITLHKESIETFTNSFNNMSREFVISASLLSNSTVVRELTEGKAGSDRSLLQSFRTDVELINREFGNKIHSVRIYDSRKRLILSFPAEAKNGAGINDSLTDLLSGKAETEMPGIEFIEVKGKNGCTIPYVVFFTPVLREDNTISGLLLFLVDLKTLTNNLLNDINIISNDLKLVDRPRILLVSSRGSIVYSSDKDSMKTGGESAIFLKLIAGATQNQPDNIQSNEVKLIRKDSLYYLSSPVHFAITYKKSLIQGPSFLALFVMPESMFHRQLSTSVLSIVIASILLVAILIGPGLFIFRALYSIERKRTQAYERELKMAYDIQMSFLPNVDVKVPGFDIYCMSRPARQVGGDFYNLIPQSSDTFYVVIGDASGKGVPGALLMVLGKTLIDFVAHQEKDPAEVVSRVNQFVEKISGAGLFITVLFGSIDTERKTLTYVTAGHNPPIRCRNGIVEELDGGRGTVLGCFQEIHFEKKEISLEKGDILIFYTDGLTDVWNDKREKIREEDIWQAVTELKNPTAEEIASKILQTVEEFQGHKEQYDDQTMIVLKVE